MLYIIKTLFYIVALLSFSLLAYRWALRIEYKKLISPKIAIIIISVPFFALLNNNPFLFFFFLTVVTAFNSRSKLELAGTYVLLLPTMPALTMDTGIGGIYLLSLSSIAAMGFGALIGSFAARSPRVKSPAFYDLCVLTLIVMFVFIYNRDGNLTVLLRGLTTYTIAFAGPFLLIRGCANNFQDIERLLLRLCAGGVIVAITGIFQARWQWIIFEAYHQTLHVPIPLTSAALSLRAGFLRTGGSMVDYTAGGMFLALVVSIFPLLRSKFTSRGFYLILLILVCGLIVTQSRGAWVAAIAGSIFVTAFRGQWGRFFILIGSTVIVELTLLTFASSSRLAQIAGQTSEASGTIDYRQRLLTLGIQQVKQHPLSGQSPESLIVNLYELRQGQSIVDFVNAHLFVAMTAGLPVFVIWATIWIFAVSFEWRKRRFSTLPAAPAAIIVSSMTCLIFTSFIDRNNTWAIIALGLASSIASVGRTTYKVPHGKEKQKIYERRISNVTAEI